MILIPHRAIRLVLFLLFAIQFCQARSTRFRVMWRTNPATSMVIGWDQVSGSNPRLYYDTQDLGVESNKYAFSEPPHQITEAKMMRNHFVRLQNLKPNTVYYFLVVDSEGSSQRYSFKTAPDTPDQPLAIVAGGDSRNYRAARRFANRMVSKIRPDLVLFAGDMTGGDSGPEWIEWLTDWQETIGADGRIFPIVVARGNHESSNRTLSQIFDVPTNSVYYGLTFGESLIRIYTLNSMIAVGGDQKTWLERDLQQNAGQVKWRMAQYHHAMRPHTKAKGEKDQQMIHWAPLFFAYQMDLVLESDSHVVKWTYPVRPSKGPESDEGFVRDDKSGTVYIGEGCWGAPLRNPDDPKTWTRAVGSFNQFKLIHVFNHKIEVRTVLTDQVNTVTPLTDENRFNLPLDFPLWKPPTGPVVQITQKGLDNPALSIKPNTTSITPEQEALERSKKNVGEWSKLKKLNFNRQLEMTDIPFRLPQTGNVTIKVFDIYNNVVRQIGLRNRPKGLQRATVPLKKLESGLYLITVKQGNKTLAYYQLLSE